MARRNLPFNKKRKSWEPRILPDAQERKKRISSILANAYKPKYEKEHSEYLERFGENVVKSRKRTGRPEIWDELASTKFWQEKPGIAAIKARSEFRKSVEYYESDRVQKILKEWKEFDPNVKLPTESPDYNNLKLMLYYGKTVEKPEEVNKRFRRWFSRKVSEPEFEQRIKNEKDNKEFIKHLYRGSRYAGDISYEKYESTFYYVMRDIFDKSKIPYGSDVVRTAILDNGIDEAIEDGGVSEDFINSVNDLIEEKFVEIESLNKKLLEGVERAPIITEEQKVRLTRMSKERRDIINNPDTYWSVDLDPDERNRLLKGKHSAKEIFEISVMFPTVGELENAQYIMSKARNGIKKKQDYDIEFFKKAHEVISNNKGLSNDILVSRLINSVENEEQAELLELTGRNISNYGDLL